MQISVIIPTLNEEKNIGQQIRRFLAFPRQDLLAEILVVDAGSQDNTVAIAEKAGAKVLSSPKRGRAAQMNHGARQAKAPILYFVHADVRPPSSCLEDIVQTLDEKSRLGCFAYYFDSKSPLLKINAWFTGFDWMANGGGDQTLFLRKSCFWKLGGFDEQLPIMEDFDFVWRAKKKKYALQLVKSRATVSARKYEKNSYLKVQIVNAITFMAFRWGYSPHKLAKWYRKMLM
ncbi:MAG TPA: TIGR04283 family arsenosugar biosynthesis glycosyltransferase [Saprospiraceae bacterium]|nr:TIGR04283 family arsenosugar biosynthesis glycosyltransferase [Saprospiraceae bacterium]